MRRRFSTNVFYRRSFRSGSFLYSAIAFSAAWILAVETCATARAADRTERVTHTVYSTTPVKDGGLQLEWTLGPDGWRSDSRIGHVTPYSDCTSLLTEQQMFALEEMVRRKILTREQLAMYATLGGRLSPRQISFFEHHSDGVLDATVWSVSGQDFDGVSLRTRVLPWMLEERWETLAMDLDRTRYKYLWEWGRAAQAPDADIDTLLDFATQKAYRELLAHGGDLDEAWITLHAITPAHALSYQRRFPGTRLSTNPIREGDSIFLIPLRTVISSHPLERRSGVLRDLHAILGAKEDAVSDLRLVQWIERFRVRLWTEINYSGPGGRSFQPLVIQDFSDWGSDAMVAELAIEGIPRPAAIAVVERLRAMTITKKMTRRNYYRDVTEKNGPSLLTEPARAVEVSGLDVAQLKKDPEYAERVLLAVALRTLKLARIGHPEADRNLLWSLLIHRKTSIAIATRDPLLSAALARLAPTEVRHFTTPSAPPGAPKEMMEVFGEDWGTTTDIHFFSFTRILEMIAPGSRFARIFVADAIRLEPGVYQREHRLVDPDLY